MGNCFGVEHFCLKFTAEGRISPKIGIALGSVTLAIEERLRSALDKLGAANRMEAVLTVCAITFSNNYIYGGISRLTPGFGEIYPRVITWRADVRVIKIIQERSEYEPLTISQIRDAIILAYVADMRLKVIRARKSEETVQ